MSQDRSSTAIAAVAAALRAAGVVFALPCFLGLVETSIAPALGGLAMVFYGRSLAEEDRSATVTCGALGVVAAGLMLGAVRWRTVSLNDIDGAQAVLGPALAVGPPLVAAAVGAAVAGCVVALGAAFEPPPTGHRARAAAWAIEIATGAIAIQAVAWGPSLAGIRPGTGGVAAVLLVGGVAAALAHLLPRTSSWRGGMVTVGAVAVSASAIVLAASLG